MIVASIRSSVPTLAGDGELVLVYPDRTRVAILPKDRFSSFRAAIEQWDEVRPHLTEIDRQLRFGEWRDTRSLSEVHVMAPLPRTWAFLDGSAFIQHVVLARRARGAELPKDLLTVPLMYQRMSDGILAPERDLPLRSQSDGMDFEGEVAIITNSVPRGTTSQDAARHILFVTLLNDVSLRELIPRELATGFGFLHGKPQAALSPFALTPDELGTDWRDGRLHLPVTTALNGTPFGSPNAGEMHFSFHDLIAYAATTRPLSAGTIIGSGTVSNENPAVGSCCIVEQRMRETIQDGAPRTPFLKDGDTVTINVVKEGTNLFGSIHQRVRGA